MTIKLRRVLFVVMVLSICIACTTPWGFYGHRLINRLAVFTVPAPLSQIYKTNIGYISEHAVDPDKRRYATKHEGVRHYIDIDVWGDNPFEEVPRNLSDAIIKYGAFHIIVGTDTMQLNKTISADSVWLSTEDGFHAAEWNYNAFRSFFLTELMPFYYEDEWVLGIDTLLDQQARELYPGATLWVEDLFSPYGILPFHLVSMQKRLTDAFAQRNKSKVLRLSSEYGHYISDAHVPLHTTVNYNGQMTNQVGIHAFWESRIPELFAENQYDFLVGSAEYIEDVKTYVWDIVEASHNELDSVLLIEKELSLTFPSDQQYCYDERLGRTIRLQCPEYAAAYQQRMAGMVERRMQGSIKAIGDLWFTAWVDGGQPNVKALDGILEEAEEISRDPNLKGVREHSF